MLVDITATQIRQRHTNIHRALHTLRANPALHADSVQRDVINRRRQTGRQYSPSARAHHSATHSANETRHHALAIRAQEYAVGPRPHKVRNGFTRRHHMMRACQQSLLQRPRMGTRHGLRVNDLCRGAKSGRYSGTDLFGNLRRTLPIQVDPTVAQAAVQSASEGNIIGHAGHFTGV